MNRIFTVIKETAKAHKLPVELVYGICMQESALNPLAVRYEPNYRWLYFPEEVKPTICSLTTEKTLQKTSWGLMQVMGAVVREYGFEGWLTEMVAGTSLQLRYGCKHLSKLIARWGLEGGIVAYNAGSPRIGNDGKYINQLYLDRVMTHSKRCPEGITAS